MKKLLSIILALAMILCLCACKGNTAPTDGNKTQSTEASKDAAPSEDTAGKTTLKVAYTANNLSNDINVETMTPIKEYCEANGHSYTEVSYDSDVAKLVDTMENFLLAEMDIVMFQSVGGEAVNDVVNRMKEAGIIVISYDDPNHVGTYYLTQSDAEIGEAIGKAAAAYVNEKLGGSAKAVALGLPSNETLTIRCNSSIEAFEANCDGEVLFTYDLANYSGDFAAIADSIKQAYGEATVILSIADSCNVQLQEGLLALGYGYDDIALFGCDTIRDVREAWINGEPTMCKASAWTHLPECMMDAFLKAVEDKANGTVTGGEIHQEAVATTPENVKEILKLG